MKEFQVNKYITLKLEDGKTNIYIDGELFEQCKFLLLNIPVSEISYFDEIDSVDEASENLSTDMEGREGEEEGGIKITPEVEFWAHSSNLQVWAEHRYDTRLIHSNLAFPLLKKLTDVGDPIAKKTFKEEIAKRVESGYLPVIEYLIEEGFTDYLSREEFLQCFLDDEKEIQFLLEVEKTNDITFYLEKELSVEYNNFTFEKKRIIGICIHALKLEGMSYQISNLNNLKWLFLIRDSIDELTDSYGDLDKLESLILTGNNLKRLPKTMKKLKSLTYLDLSSNSFGILPEVIEKLQSLESLASRNNRLDIIPDSLLKLSKLTYLDLRKNEVDPNSEIIKKLRKKGVDVKI